MKNKKGIVICALLVAIVAMAVGYATLSQELTITGTANIDAAWNVKITGITEGTLVNAETVETDSSVTSATFEVNLSEPGASATYNVAIENAGSIDAVLESIDGVDAANSAAPTDITFEVTGVQVGDTLGADGSANDTATAIVTVTWNAESEEIPEVKSKTATITLNYVQATEQATGTN